VNQRRITEQVSSLGTGLAAVQKALDGLTSQVESFRETLAAGNSRVDRLESKICDHSDSMGGRMDSQEGRCTEVEEKLKELEKTVISYKKDNSRLQNEFETQENTLERLREEVTSLRSTLQLVQPNWIVSAEEIVIGDRELGRGGWGYVREATFRGCRVAAKCLYNEIITGHNARLFHREMLIASRCRHPNLLQFIGATQQGMPIILTELMETSLRALLQQQSLQSCYILPICRDVAMAINYLHHLTPHPVIHRDVSSANVLLNSLSSGGWLAKLSDYGSANFAWHSRTVGPGSPAYAAPEASSAVNHSTKMDVYSYGVLLFELCTGEFPDYATMGETLAAPKWDPPCIHLVQVIKSCVKIGPDDRPTMEAILECINRL